MPIYEYRCRDCDERFELRRAMAEADAPATCPSGHDDAVRLLPVFASTGRASVSSASAASAATAGPCGGGCACFPS